LNHAGRDLLVTGRSEACGQVPRKMCSSSAYMVMMVEERRGSRRKVRRSDMVVRTDNRPRGFSDKRIILDRLTQAFKIGNTDVGSILGGQVRLKKEP
jgi:hypothetical protein